MPTNNGAHSLPVGNPVVPGTDITADWANQTMSDLSQGLTDRLMADGTKPMTGALRHSDGTVNNPSQTYNSESGLGWYRKASNTIALASAGVERLSVSASTATLNVDLVLSASKSLTVGGNLSVTGTLSLPGTSSQFVRGDGQMVALSTLAQGTVTSVAAGNGLNFSTITATGSVTLGTPSSVTLSSTNSVTTNSHTHALALGGTSGQYLRGDGQLATFPSIPQGTVTSVASGNGMNFSTVTSTGTITLGTPSNVTLSSSNSVTSNSHTHAFAPGGSSSQYIRGDGALASFPSLGTMSSQNSNNVSITGGSASGLSSLSVSGTISATDVTISSDERLKTNLKVIDDALDRVTKLTGYTFDRIGFDRRFTGLIAQDVKQVLPEAVLEVDSYLTVSYGPLMGLMVEAIKDLKDEIDALKRVA